MNYLTATARVIGLPLIVGWAMIGFSQKSADAVPLPTCNDPVNCLIFEDFTVYSLELLNTISGTNDFDQQSSPGFLKQNAITIGSGAGGTFNNNSFIDEPYDTPNSVPGGSTFVNFEMITVTDPAPTFTGDNTVTGSIGSTGAVGDIWDATTEALRAFFEPGQAVVFYFNLNEENQGGLDDGQDMYGWLQVTLTDLDGILADQVFTLSGALGFSGGDLGGSAAQTAGVDDILPTANDLWAHVHGEICVDPANQADPFVGFGSCAEQPVPPPGTAVTVNQNLGADQAAFALFNQQLSDLILDPLSGYEIVSVDLRMSRTDNGFEQLFILPTQVGIQIPEPSSIAMFVAGLLGFAPFLRRRRVN